MRTKSYQPGLLFLMISVASAVFLRLLWLDDMEYKWDEHYNFTVSQTQGWLWSWPSVGMPASAGIPNAGLSVWVFILLAKLSGATDPLALAHAVVFLNLTAFALLLGFIFRSIAPHERGIWLQGWALACVSPIAVILERKIWAPSVFPFFSVLVLIGWWNRNRRVGALLWGFFGSLLGQIQLAGHFYSFSLFLWTLIRGKIRPIPQKICWGYWIMGSILGSLLMVPWLLQIESSTGSGNLPIGSMEVYLKPHFWWLWPTDALGLTFGYSLGIRDFYVYLAYPIFGNQKTWIVAVLTCFLLWAGLRLIVPPTVRVIRTPGLFISTRLSEGGGTSLLLTGGALLYGIVMTVLAVPVTRHYLSVAFPLCWVWFAGLLSGQGFSQKFYVSIWVAQFLLALIFLTYIHVNGGAPDGHYGTAFSHQRESPVP